MELLQGRSTLKAFNSDKLTIMRKGLEGPARFLFTFRLNKILNKSPHWLFMYIQSTRNIVARAQLPVKQNYLVRTQVDCFVFHLLSDFRTLLKLNRFLFCQTLACLNSLHSRFPIIIGG